MEDQPRDERTDKDATGASSDLQRLFEASSFGSPQAHEAYIQPPPQVATDILNRVRTADVVHGERTEPDSGIDGRQRLHPRHDPPQPLPLVPDKQTSSTLPLPDESNLRRADGAWPKSMDRMPETRLLLGVDVISSAANEGHQYSALFRALDRMLGAALHGSGIDLDEILDQEPGGDGALFTLPSTRLGAVLDLTDRLDKLAAAHNRSRKPDIRLRIAVETGPVGDERGYYAPKISHSRLSNAPAFTQLMRYCLQECPENSVNSGLIVSAAAFREAFGGDYTWVVRRHEFTEIAVTENKEFGEHALVRVRGLDARTLAEFVSSAEHDGPAFTPEPLGRVVNQVFGPMNGVQAGDIHGDIHFGDSR